MQLVGDVEKTFNVVPGNGACEAAQGQGRKSQECYIIIERADILGVNIFEEVMECTGL